MSKIIVERPRLGSKARATPGRTRVVEDDDGEPLRAPRGGREPTKRAEKTKSLNENLNPLKRYLESNVGRPWNKVFSEISEHLKPTSRVQQHVRDHLEDFVAIKTRMKGGKVVVANSRFGGERTVDDSYYRFFVHPRTGLLKKNDKRINRTALARLIRETEAAERDARMRVVDTKTQLHLFGGAWWEVKLAKIGDGREPDVVLRAKLSALAPEKLYARGGVRACEKRQLSKAEMKKLKLR